MGQFNLKIAHLKINLKIETSFGSEKTASLKDSDYVIVLETLNMISIWNPIMKENQNKTGL